jgi:hypothetical protein
MLKQNIVVLGKSDFLFVVQAPGKEARVCVDYRALNKLTKDQIFAFPFVSDWVEKVATANFITLLDLSRGYWQASLEKKGRKGIQLLFVQKGLSSQIDCFSDSEMLASASSSQSGKCWRAVKTRPAFFFLLLCNS